MHITTNYIHTYIQLPVMNCCVQRLERQLGLGETLETTKDQNILVKTLNV